jgi:hypothetical protein
VTNIPVLLEFVRHVSPKPSLAELDKGRRWLDEKVAEHYKLILKRKQMKRRKT